MDKTIYRQSKVMGFAPKVINLVFLGMTSFPDDLFEEEENEEEREEERRRRKRKRRKKSKFEYEMNEE